MHCTPAATDPAPSAWRIGGMACSSLRASSRRTTRRCPAPSLPLPASVPDTWSLQPRQRVVYQGTTLNCGESLQRARTGRRGMRRRAPPKRDVGRRFVGSTLVRASAGDIQRKKRTVSHTHITSQPTVSMSDRATHRYGGFGTEASQQGRFANLPCQLFTEPCTSSRMAHM
jgi:hypothetical protein